MMVAEVFFHCCKHGHPWTAYTTMICNGRRRCRICHNRRVNAGIKERYRNDPAFRRKVCQRDNARRQARKAAASNANGAGDVGSSREVSGRIGEPQAT